MEPERPADRLVVKISWDVMVLAAAIDPRAEAGPVDLDKDVVSGRYLSTSDKPGMRSEPGQQEGFTRRYLSVPAVVAILRLRDGTLVDDLDLTAGHSPDLTLARINTLSP